MLVNNLLGYELIAFVKKSIEQDIKQSSQQLMEDPSALKEKQNSEKEFLIQILFSFFII